MYSRTQAAPEMERDRDAERKSRERPMKLVQVGFLYPPGESAGHLGLTGNFAKYFPPAGMCRPPPLRLPRREMRDREEAACVKLKTTARRYTPACAAVAKSYYSREICSRNCVSSWREEGGDSFFVSRRSSAFIGDMFGKRRGKFTREYEDYAIWGREMTISLMPKFLSREPRRSPYLTLVYL